MSQGISTVLEYVLEYVARNIVNHAPAFYWARWLANATW